ncbi:uncharacterized protein LOC127706722 [Mytilus californianus]|uniref:uncharacterized protein LOC127706722 n=1 Tax=Mytilus californianus TaxID=6549 RepID=UPI002245BD40|nr:uncharacterized protein LOC127706722 [Mytilus californianus]
MFGYLIFLSFLGSVLCCCFPKQWEGWTYQTSSHTLNNGSVIYEEESSSLSVDYNKGFAYYNQTTDTNSGQTKQIILQDFNKNKEYVIQNNKCTTLNYTTSVELACIPMGSKILSRSYVGAGMTKLNATLYKYMDITGTRFYFEVVDDGCIPLMTDTASPNWLGEGSKKTTVTYMGISKGIQNPSVFNVPAICMK